MVDAAISCLPPPPPPALLATTNFADVPIALHFSMSSAADLPPYAPHATTCVHSVLRVAHDSPRCSPPAARSHHQLAPAAGRAGKRRSRPSKRAPTTYITTDPSNFRIMVQHITGVQAEPAEVDDMLLQPTTAAALLLAADTGAAGAYGNHPLLPLPGADEASSAPLPHHHQQQQLQPCFPTLDSWNVMYDRNDLPPL